MRNSERGLIFSLPVDQFCFGTINGFSGAIFVYVGSGIVIERERNTYCAFRRSYFPNFSNSPPSFFVRILFKPLNGAFFAKKISIRNSL